MELKASLGCAGNWRPSKISILKNIPSLSNPGKTFKYSKNGSSITVSVIVKQWKQAIDIDVTNVDFVSPEAKRHQMFTLKQKILHLLLARKWICYAGFKTQGSSLLQSGYEKRPSRSLRPLIFPMLKIRHHFITIRSPTKSTKYLLMTQGITLALSLSMVVGGKLYRTSCK